MPATLRALLDRTDLGLRLLTAPGTTQASTQATTQDASVHATDPAASNATTDATVTNATAGPSDVEIAWLHSSDLADPTPFLAAGQALMTTGTQFGQDARVDRSVTDAYVARLVDRGVTALGFGTEVVRAGTPDTLVASCRAAGLPLFEVPYRTSFIAVTQANADVIARDANARNAWALAAQRAISLAAMRPDGLGATLAELSRQLDCWVGLLDVSGHLDRAFPDAGITADELRVVQDEAVRLLRGGHRASLPVPTERRGFTLQTLGTGGRLHGVLAIAPNEALDAAGREVVTAVIALAGLALQQNRELGRARGLLRTGLLSMLSAGDPTVVETTSRELWGPLPAEPVRVAAVHVDDRDVDAVVDLLELWVQSSPGRLFFAVDDALYLCVPADDTEALDQLVGRYDLHAGLSDGATWRSFARARSEAVQAMERSREGSPGVVEFGDLARDGVLAHLARSDARAVARAFLAPVVEHDRTTGAELTRTVRTWLEHDCEYDRTARALGVHRHTAKARVEHAGRLLGRDLGIFATRADLWAAFVADGDVPA